MDRITTVIGLQAAGRVFLALFVVLAGYGAASLISLGGLSGRPDVAIGDEIACSDATDNDGDGKTDYPADPGCTDASDNDEADPVPPTGTTDTTSTPTYTILPSPTVPNPSGGGSYTIPSDGPLPVAGRSGDIEAIRGIVLVKVPGSSRFVRVRSLKQIPVGSTINTLRGAVRLTVDNGGVLQGAKLAGGSFVFSQSAAPAGVAQGIPRLMADATLVGGSFRGCKTRARSGATISARTRLSDRLIRRLAVRARGRFRTRGRYAAAVVRGTAWSFKDKCRSTWTQVSEGIVDVTDLVRRATFKIGRGQTYIARRR